MNLGAPDRAAIGQHFIASWDETPDSTAQSNTIVDKAPAAPHAEPSADAGTALACGEFFEEVCSPECLEVANLTS